MTRALFEEKEIMQVKKFLVENKFKRTTPDVLHALSILVYKSSQSATLVMNNEYAELAATDSNGETYRAKLGYYISKNYNDVHASILEKYNYDIGNFFSGVKSFVEQMGIVYALYVRE